MIMKHIATLACFLGAFSWLSAQTNLTERQQQILAAAPTGPAPRFNGARIIGLHPNTPLLFQLPASGKRPLKFSAEQLPPGLTLDPRTGILTGTFPQKGEFTFTARAANASGKASAKFKVVVGDSLALTAPMGWNSYDAFGDNVIESEILTNTHYVADHLQPFGWDTIVVDYRWYDPGAHDNNPNGRTNAALTTDQCGRLLPAPNRFPSASDGTGFRSIADTVHSLGLHFGIHVMRGIPRNSVKANLPIEGSGFFAANAADTNDACNWCPDMFGVQTNAAGQAWYDSCARLWDSWAVDYIKVDDLSSPYRAGEVEMIRNGLDRCGRSIVFSTSPGETPVEDALHVATHANLWRVSGDFWDEWRSLKLEFPLAARWKKFVGPGHWPDADMLPVGHLSIQHRSEGNDRFTRFTRDEQLTLISLWCLLPSPLMVGANLPDNDAWTLALLTNPEVLAVNQDSLEAAAKPVVVTNNIEIWVKPLSDGSSAVGIFNRGRLEDFDEAHALYKSPLVSRQTPGNSVDVDVTIAGARKLWLVVDDGGDGSGYDHADWLNPRLSGPNGETNLTQIPWTSASTGYGTVVVDRSIGGSPLIVDGQAYTNGIGTHAASVIEYTLPPGYTRFTARAGVDRSGISMSPIGATVHFLVFTSEPRFPALGASIQLDWKQAGLGGARQVRDLWLHRDLGRMKQFHSDLPPHGCLLLKVK